MKSRRQQSILIILIIIVGALLQLDSCKSKEEPVPTPRITSFAPAKGVIGTAVTIIGTNFKLATADNIVKFNGTAAIVTASSATSITASVPVGASTGKITVTANDKTATSTSDFIVLIPPTITTISPGAGRIGETIAITGTNFGEVASANTVKFNGISVQSFTSVTPTLLTVVIPDGATTGKISVTVNDLTATTSVDFAIIPPPTIESMSPASGLVGTTVVITGTNFSTVAAENIVKFANVVAAVVAATATTLNVVVPAFAVTGNVTVTIAKESGSSANVFNVIPTISGFHPVIGAPGTEVTVTGTGLGNNVIVSLGGTNATVLEYTSSGSLRFRVPANATTGLISIIAGTLSPVYSATSFEVAPELITVDGPEYEQAFAVAIDANGNTYMTGSFAGTVKFDATTSLTSAGNEDLFLAKYNAHGDLIWSRRAGGTDSDRGMGLVVDGSGNITVTGYMTNAATFGSFSFTANGSDMFVAQWNSSGDVQWLTPVTADNTGMGFGIALDPSGNLYASGSFINVATVGASTLTSAGASDVCVIKLSSSGAVIWAKRAGGILDDAATGIAVDNAGNSFVVGTFFGTTVFGSTQMSAQGEFDGFVARFNENGDPVWAQQLGGSGNDMVRSVDIKGTGDCFVTGYFTGTATLGSSSLTTNPGFEDIVVARLSRADGTTAWAKSAGGSSYDEGMAIVVDNNGNSYETGYYTGNANFGDNSIGGSNVNFNAFVSKYDASGNCLWIKGAGGSDERFSNGIAVSSVGPVPYVTIMSVGSFRGNATFGVTDASASGTLDDAYLWKIWE